MEVEIGKEQLRKKVIRRHTIHEKCPSVRSVKDSTELLRDSTELVKDSTELVKDLTEDRQTNEISLYNGSKDESVVEDGMDEGSSLKDIVEDDNSIVEKDILNLEEGPAETDLSIVIGNILSKEELEKELERLTQELNDERRANERLRRVSKAREIKVSPKGAVQINNIRKFPITFYLNEWEMIIEMIPQIQEFIKDHRSELKKI